MINNWGTKDERYGGETFVLIFLKNSVSLSFFLRFSSISEPVFCVESVN